MIDVIVDRTGRVDVVEREPEVGFEVVVLRVDRAVLLVGVLTWPSAHSQAFQRPFGPSAGSGDESLGLSNT